jgi:hypothetical protein
MAGPTVLPLCVFVAAGTYLPSRFLEIRSIYSETYCKQDILFYMLIDVTLLKEQKRYLKVQAPGRNVRQNFPEKNFHFCSRT